MAAPSRPPRARAPGGRELDTRRLHPRELHTRGQAAAVAAVEAMLSAHVPQALLLAGLQGVGKTTLALDLAAGRLCLAADPDARPCRTCRACRAVAHGNHPDLHRLAPAGAGQVIAIGGRGERGVRDLVSDLALLPVEGGARVAIIEAAQRMTEDAQSALLKTLEEPPRDATIVLCADDEERLLPTIRSRCVRLRLGPVPRTDVEAILIDRGLADASAASRYARLSGGRPGVALAYAAAPEAAVIRSEITRGLLDLSTSARVVRLSRVRDLAARATELVSSLALGVRRLADSSGDQPPAESRITPEPDAATDGAAGAPGAVVRVPAAERRAAALLLVELWRDVLRDLAAVVGHEPRLVRDIALLDDLEAAAPRFDDRAVGRALTRLETAGEQLEGNVSPELVLDVLALRVGA